MGQIILTCKKFFLTLFFFLISFQVFSKEAEKNNYGNYLSWNFARQTGDVDRIKDLFVNVKIHEIAPNLLEEVFFESVVFNEWSEARKISDFILKQDEINFTANLFNFVDEFLKKNDQSKKFIKKIDTNHFDSNFIKVLLLWSSNSIKEIDDINNNIDCIPLICLHSGIFLMLSNDKTKAENYFNKLLHSKFASYRIKELLLNNYLELKRFDVAENILNDLNELELNFKNLDSKYFLKKSYFLNPVLNNQHGLAEVFYNISSWYYSKDLYKYAAFFGKIALRLRPDFNAMKLLLVGSYEKLGYRKLAIESLKGINENNLYFLKFFKIKISLFEEISENEEILNDLKKLVKKFPKNLEMKILLADKLRSIGDYNGSIKYYTEIIEDIVVDDKWSVYYSRGIAYERSNQWQDAENDLKQALKLKPNDPYVLNYLAYSWLDRNTNVNQALELLKMAVEIEPSDAYITDSLGWAYYLSGFIEKSIYFLEKAVSLSPNDSTLNDHLGDAYWKAGRTNEALSQWKRVLIFDPSFKKKEYVRQKIEKGL